MKPFRYSTLSDAHKCLKYYELKHLLGLSDGSEKSGDMKFGTAIHLGVQDLFEGGDGVDVFTVMWELEEGAGLEYSRYGHAELLSIGRALLEIFRDEQLKHFEPAHLEKKLTTTLGRHSFGGTIDFVGLYKGKNSTVDWKTAAYPYDRYKLVCNEQTYGYAHLAKAELGFESEQVVYGVAVKDAANPRWQFKVEPVTAEKQASVMANIEAMCDRVADTKVFIRNPAACVIGKRICPFFNRCHGGESGGGET